MSVAGRMKRSWYHERANIACRMLGLISGILGLGPYLTGFAINQSYPRVLDNMFKQGLVNSRAYGLHLGDSDDATGSLTFGGLDRGKFIGALQGVPILRSRDNRARLTVDYDLLSLSLPSNGTKKYIINDTNVLLDSGTTFINLEPNLAEPICEELGATVDNSTGYPIVDCSVRNWTGGLTFTFGSKLITISYHCLIFAADGLCAVGIQALPSGEQQILGVPFLRATYAIFDFDDLNRHLAQAGNCTSELMIIEPGNGYFNTTGSCSGDTTPTSSTPAGSTPTASLGTKPVESYWGLTACLLFINAVLLGAI
ncbi:putative Peptidase A1 domain-containing protein [Seiridium cardinale]|uniref:Peptidase A1 domain-containing protein n=1 Tax=Seiridium cardinale TaxID=138064 RepID=A0ABR2Y4D4_9PEZI